MTRDGGLYRRGGLCVYHGLHRLPTGEMEEVVSSHLAEAECAVVGIAVELCRQRPVGLVVLKDGQTVGEGQLEQVLVALIREKIGVVACFHSVFDGKQAPEDTLWQILRKIIRHMADGVHYAVPSTVDDPAILTEIRDL
ncbi:AMP-binding enzyme [Pontibacter ummariensis]|uniref:AMP-binding enzyme C-terminal domain-containing protein n=1 Tax=Pontibacter ummariensis TaxID=1610492 RepID=A0A239E7F3_9BACT|nr:acetate--CoA ligase [Pontibacter ummariensis]PRY13114.1 AMP-binding enzyme [Pontibacter ummariensis]SNS40389.1 AMP-binding enzyme C-terminal domain-containing protein [Pontibacter ummariensis]